MREESFVYPDQGVRRHRLKERPCLVIHWAADKIVGPSVPDIERKDLGEFTSWIEE